MPIKTMPRRLPEIGRIRLGQQVPNATGNGTHPVSLDHFRLTSPSPEDIGGAQGPADGERRRMSGHTSGPWTTYHRHSEASPHDDELDGLGWQLQGPEEPMLRGTFAKAADAYLVAAAPDLLDALKRAESALAIAASYVNREQASMQRALDAARAAIAKARGVGGTTRERTTVNMAGSARDWDLVQ